MVIAALFVETARFMVGREEPSGAGLLSKALRVAVTLRCIGSSPNVELSGPYCDTWGAPDVGLGWGGSSRGQHSAHRERGIPAEAGVAKSGKNCGCRIVGIRDSGSSSFPITSC